MASQKGYPSLEVARCSCPQLQHVAPDPGIGCGRMWKLVLRCSCSTMFHPSLLEALLGPKQKHTHKDFVDQEGIDWTISLSRIQLESSQLWQTYGIFAITSWTVSLVPDRPKHLKGLRRGLDPNTKPARLIRGTVTWICLAQVHQKAIHPNEENASTKP